MCEPGSKLSVRCQNRCWSIGVCNVVTDCFIKLMSPTSETGSELLKVSYPCKPAVSNVNIYNLNARFIRAVRITVIFQRYFKMFNLFKRCA